MPENELVQTEQAKIADIIILNAEQKNALAKGAEYSTIPYFPISQDFIKTYILNDTEYPLLEGKLSQAATEMKTRLANLVDSNYQYRKLALEVEELELEIQESESSNASSARKDLVKRQKELEKQMKTYRMNSIRNDAASQFTDFMNWQKVVDECLEAIKSKEKDVKTHTDVPYDKIRCAEMAIKVARWRAMASANMELSPSQQIYVYDKEWSALPMPKSLFEMRGPKQPEGKIIAPNGVDCSALKGTMPNG